MVEKNEMDTVDASVLYAAVRSDLIYVHADAHADACGI